MNRPFNPNTSSKPSIKVCVEDKVELDGGKPGANTSSTTSITSIQLIATAFN